MPIGRIFGDLSIFDLLGNFVPGTVLLGGVFLLLPADRVTQVLSSPLIAAFSLGIVAFALGHLAQSYAAQAVGNRETFRNSILVHQSLGTSELLNFEKYPSAHPKLYSFYSCIHPDEPDEREVPSPNSEGSQSETTNSESDVVMGEGVLDSKIIIFKMTKIPARGIRALLEVSLMIRIKRDRPLSDVTLAGKTWEICRKKFDLDKQYGEYGDLLHLISSDIETQAGSSRALRFQAIRNFHRGMWVASYFSLATLSTIVISRVLPAQVKFMFGLIGIATWRPIVLDLWTPVWVLCVGYAVLMYLFWELKEDFEEEFIEYLLTDFLSIHSNLTEEIDSEAEEVAWKQRNPPRWYN